ncbi:aminoacyl-tRNA hydrolase [Candidatus Dependentiae bacterium]|nr:aminoacyl-tRNA hydrolase [Candidatus Dependentiae bacterium]
MNQTYDKDQIRAIIGLGNPGDKYYKTRHNIGFRVLDALAEQYSVSWQKTGNMLYATITSENGQSLYLIKPQTFMNSSGEVLPWLNKKGIKGAQIVVVHDELEKAFGSNVIKFGGSAKGHNGLRSIMGMIGQDFWRLRFGIGRPQDETPIHNYVLNPFNQTEEAQLVTLIEQACKLLLEK